MAKVGILGGSFNPPHNGHVSLARHALTRLGLDRVLLIPAGEAPHKVIEGDPGPRTRLELCEAACEGVDGLEVSSIEVDRPGPSWTVDTLRSLHEAAPDDHLVLLVGEDMAASLDTWREPTVILELAELAWVERPGVGDGQSSADRIDSIVTGLGGHATLLDMGPIDISSTRVRERIEAGDPVGELVPSSVASLIGKLGLYRRGARRSEAA